MKKMKKRGTLPSTSLAVILCCSALLVGCSEQTITEDRVARHSTQSASTGLSFDGLTVDQVFGKIGERVPSFAGLYFDQSGALVIQLTNLADSSIAWPLVREALSARYRFDPRRPSPFSGDLLVAPKGRRFEHGSVAFTRLFALKARLEASVHSSDEAVFLDLEEQSGRVVIGVEQGRSADSFRAGLRLAADDDSLVIVRTAARLQATQSPTLYYRRRPLTGGYEIGPLGCPMTTGVHRGTEQLALTASHCTSVSYGLDGGWMSQPYSGTHFGAEVTDPSPYSCGTLFSPKKCRKSDAAAYDASAADLFPGETLAWAPGLIARTTYSSPGTSMTDGSIVIDTLNPAWTVNAEIAYPLSGDVLHKIGVVTGWTYGSIYKTCADSKTNWGSGYVWIVCSDWAAMYNQKGDSGGPVFSPSAGYSNTASFYGVVFGKDGANGVVFSNLTQMRQDLGSISLF